MLFIFQWVYLAPPHPSKKITNSLFYKWLFVDTNADENALKADVNLLHT